MTLSKADERRIAALDRAIEYHRGSAALPYSVIETAKRFLTFIAPLPPTKEK